MNRPRFEDVDFIARDDRAASQQQQTLGLSERGMELLQSINQLIDHVTAEQTGGSDSPIIIQYTEK